MVSTGDVNGSWQCTFGIKTMRLDETRKGRSADHGEQMSRDCVRVLQVGEALGAAGC